MMVEAEMEETYREHGWLDRHFKLSQRKTSLRTEIVAGLTTFIAMAYLIFVIPGQFLIAAGIPQASATAATILSTAVATLLMGIYANQQGCYGLRPGAWRCFYFHYGWQHGLKLANCIRRGFYFRCAVLYFGSNQYYQSSH
jgi:AGZA family xanthine/uracil permease-like MFS transporter